MTRRQQVIDTHEWLQTRLEASFSVTRTAIELAGGPEALNERFATRLGAFMPMAAEAFEVQFTEGMVVATPDRPGLRPKLILLTAMLYEWRDHDPAVRYELSGYGFGCGDLPDDERFLTLFRAVDDLVGDWPEMRRLTLQGTPQPIQRDAVVPSSAMNVDDRQLR